ncbi:malto-oligosyltrehalose synthase [Kocuria rhizophila]|uniref:Maltooligosyl trehalose synthase n=1 Tax=Kocuria rhizophila (strain ATCC 9341 / DSM 348 / NBRC 103217 / DC2201) TaxID=378753 RepID=B2GJ33_KOCRD|nr:malto-oligosyltrehalose synthase [Kocuria rhizophila]AVJ53386.1 malto-oligosyltrehalose synthase [Kocuria rhizophila]BAG29003.1 maltooligosyl trehalose synthase [Kocuria rhizophila DC2201]VEH75708.1 Maltooligosyl trehalose synthase [Kocuria rhizophila]
MLTPTSTYRLQITSQQDLHRAAELVLYIRRLGADWVYLSPILRATSGSDHGYDVVDPTEVDPERGGSEGLRALSEAAHAAGLGVVVDIVPNHQGVAEPQQNPWWWSLLAEGRESRYADAFDVDWEAGHGKVLIPVLGDGDEDLSALTLQDGTLRYYDSVYPLAEGTWSEGDNPAEVHSRQHYELVNWRRGDSELNYRRFFTVATLAGVRVEDRAVFDESHAEVSRWFRKGLVDGLRIDHPDGVRDPRGYLEMLAGVTDGAWTVVEKILEPGEYLPEDWRTAGTTGYDSLGWIDRVLTDARGHYELASLDTKLRGGTPVRWDELIHETKRRMADEGLSAEIHRLVRELPGDFPHGAEASYDGLAEIAANFPVYRTYLPEGAEHLRVAVAAARERRADLDVVLTDLARVLGQGATRQEDLAEVARRFQQTSGMIMAKGVEDTAFYRWTKLTSLTEVGGDPSIFSLTPEQFHEEAAKRQRECPATMNALTTHDTKRSAAVRARITVLSELPRVWSETVSTLVGRAKDAGISLSDGPAVNLVLQAVVGAWPLERDRAVDYAMKAVREASVSTAWVDGDENFERELTRFIDFLFTNPRARGVVEGCVARVSGPGWANALAATALQLTLPGVPDIYQGQELWEPSLVDPDNRRSVDFTAREAMLTELDAAAPGSAAATPAVDETGAARMLLTSRALRLRRDHPELFTDYTPLETTGALAEHALGFDRGGAATVVTRFPATLAAEGGFTDETVALAPGLWQDVLTHREFTAAQDARVTLAELLDTYPVAILRRKDG